MRRTRITPALIRAASPQQRAQISGRELAAEIPHFKADQNENDAVQNEHRGFPHGARLEAGHGGHELTEVPAEVNPSGDAGEDGGDVKLLGDDPGKVGGQERHRDLAGAVEGHHEHQARETADAKSDEDSAQTGKDKLKQSLVPEKRPGDHRPDRRPVEDERRRIIDQAFALQNGHEPAWNAQVAGDGRRGHRIGRRNDRTDNYRRRPIHAGDDGMRQPGHHSRRGEDQPDGQQTDRTEIGTKVPPRCEIRRPPQDRRKEDEKDEAGMQLNARQVWHEPQHKPAQHQDNGIRQQQPGRQRRQREDDRQEHDDEFELV